MQVDPGQNDSQNDPNVGGAGGTPYTQTPPNYISGPSATNVAQIQQWYQQYLGRLASLDEVNSQLGNPGGLSAVQTLIQNSPEAQAYAARNTPPPGGGGGPAPTGGGTTTTGPTTTTSPFPTFTPPPFTTQTGVAAPNPYTFTPFSYGDFSAPTLADAQNQPGYQFGLQQGQQALENSAAARGTLRGGGTLKDLFGYTNAAAEQNYGNVFNQDLTSYNTNRDNAFGTWTANNAGNLSAFNTNFGAAKDVSSTANNAAQANYNNAFSNAAGAFNPLFNASTLSFQDSYQRWLASLNSLTSIATAGAN